ncbi:MAG: hypothetical protein ACTS44_01565 [Candidatus Hodgkinia cicadicola]
MGGFLPPKAERNEAKGPFERSKGAVELIPLRPERSLVGRERG